MKKRTVALYGNDLLLSSIGACLKQKPEFRVVRIEGTLADCLKKTDAIGPEAVLFDLAAAHQVHFAVSLMRRHSEMIFVGIDLTDNKMLILSGETSRLLTIEDLISGIEKGFCGSNQPTNQRRKP